MEKHYLLAQTFIFISFQKSVQLLFGRYEANLRISSGSVVASVSQVLLDKSQLAGTVEIIQQWEV